MGKRMAHTVFLPEDWDKNLNQDTEQKAEQGNCCYDSGKGDVCVDKNEEKTMKTTLTQAEFCAHFEDDNFFEKYPDPILIECDNGKKCACISWERVQEHLQLLDKMRRMARPGYDPEKEVTIKVTMDEDIYNQLEIICAQSGYTVAGALEEYTYWIAKNPDEAKVWIEKIRQDGTLDECMKETICEVEW